MSCLCRTKGFASCGGFTHVDTAVIRSVSVHHPPLFLFPVTAFKPVAAVHDMREQQYSHSLCLCLLPRRLSHPAPPPVNHTLHHEQLFLAAQTDAAEAELDADPANILNVGACSSVFSRGLLRALRAHVLVWWMQAAPAVV